MRFELVDLGSDRMTSVIKLDLMKTSECSK